MRKRFKALVNRFDGPATNMRVRLIEGMKMRRMGIVAVVLALQPAAASAQGSITAGEKSSPLASHLPLQKEACFGRVYDGKHLATHPRQRVTSLLLFRDFTPDTNAEYPPDDRQALLGPDGEDGRVNLSAYVRLRDRKGVYSNSFSCNKSDKGDVICGIDCDGGSFRLKAAGAGLDLVNEGFVVVGGCGGNEEDQANSVFVRPGSDDRTFRLAPQPLNVCVAEREAMKPVIRRTRRAAAHPACNHRAALLRAQLRRGASRRASEAAGQAHRDPETEGRDRRRTTTIRPTN